MSRQDNLQQDTIFRILMTLDKNPKVSQRELAKRLNISLGAINYCIKSLISKGQVKIQNFQTSDNKSKYIYLLTPHGISEKAKITSKFLIRKIEEYESLRVEIENLSRELSGRSIQDSISTNNTRMSSQSEKLLEVKSTPDNGV